MVEKNQKSIKNTLESLTNKKINEYCPSKYTLTFCSLLPRDFCYERDIDVEFTSHAINRMSERGANVFEAIEYFRRGTVVMSKNPLGFEILMPFKGIFAGDFDNGVFIIKTFLHPFRIGKSQNTNQSRKQAIRIRSLRLPQFLKHEIHQYSKLDLNPQKFSK
jgi:hypothetical protein